jgi:long-chain acyl-CoA synthetase
MDGWNEEDTLRLIEANHVSNTHMVATMFQRLLALPDDIRNKYDLNSLHFVLHGAAPTPVHVKKAIIDWFGPVVYEYYAATEGGGCFIDSEEWLRKPGSVGKPSPGQVLQVRGDDGVELPRGTTGTVYFKAPDVGRFEYYKDETKTADAYSGDFFTLGDQGYMDEDDYVFLTGRTSEVIISGGVNIYPAEIDAVLVMHDAVADAATVGIPNEDWGEEVRAVVQLRDGVEPSEALKDELVQFARERLAHFKCPKAVDFDPELPRHETGKIYRRLVRDRYWTDREQKI